MNYMQLIDTSTALTLLVACEGGFLLVKGLPFLNDNELIV